MLAMEDHLPVFVLNGYENLSLFKDMDDPELDYLGIVDPVQVEQRSEEWREKQSRVSKSGRHTDAHPRKKLYNLRQILDLNAKL